MSLGRRSVQLKPPNPWESFFDSLGWTLIYSGENRLTAQKNSCSIERLKARRVIMAVKKERVWHVQLDIIIDEAFSERLMFAFDVQTLKELEGRLSEQADLL